MSVVTQKQNLDHVSDRSVFDQMRLSKIEEKERKMREAIALSEAKRTERAIYEKSANSARELRSSKKKGLFTQENFVSYYHAEDDFETVKKNVREKKELPDVPKLTAKGRPSDYLSSLKLKEDRRSGPKIPKKLEFIKEHNPLARVVTSDDLQANTNRDREPIVPIRSTDEEESRRIKTGYQKRMEALSQRRDKERFDHEAADRSAAILVKRGFLASRIASIKQSIKKKTEYMELNSAAYLLANYDMKKAHKKEVKRLHSNAAVWKEDYNYRPKAAMKPDLGAFSSALALHSRGFSVVDRETLDCVLKSVRNPAHRRELEKIYSIWVKMPKVLKNKSYLDSLNRDFGRASAGFDVGRVQGHQQSRFGRSVVSARVGGVPVDVELPSTTDIVDLLGGPNAISKAVVSFVCCLVSIVECHTGLNVFMNLVNFANTNFSGGMLADVISYLQRSFPSWQLNGPRGSFEVQAGSLEKEISDDKVVDVLRTPTHSLESFMSSSIGSSLWGVCSTLSTGAILLAVGVPGDLATVIRTKKKFDSFFPGKDGFDTFLGRMIKFTSVVASKLRDAIIAKDINVLFSGGSIQDWMETALCLTEDACVRIDNARPGAEQMFKEKLKLGKLPARIFSQLTEENRLALCCDLLDEYPSFAVVLKESKDFILNKNVDRVYLSLLNLKYELETKHINGEFRVEPFGVFIYGTPGTGKSDMTRTIHTALGNSRGLPISPESRYDHLRASNFYDTANGAQWFCVCDDIDHSVGNVSYADKKHPEVVVELINKKPFQMEQADVARKGKIFCNFLAVLYCTNFKNARLQGFSREPIAFWRRFSMSIGVFVKEHFSTAKGLLDVERLDGSNDYWAFKVGIFDDRRWDENNPFISFPFREEECDSLVEVMKVVTHRFNSKLDRETKRLKSLMGTFPDFCPHCFISLDLHPNTPCVILQGNIPPALGGPIPQMSASDVGAAFGVVALDICDVIYEKRWILAALSAVATGIGLAVKFSGVNDAAEVQGIISDGNLQQLSTNEPGYVRKPFSRDPYDTAPLKTSTVAGLVENVKKRLVHVTTQYSTVHGLHIEGSVVLVPAHVLIDCDGLSSIVSLRSRACDFEEIETTFSRGEFKYTMLVVKDVNAYQVPNREYVLVNVVGLFPTNDGFDFIKHLPGVSLARNPGVFDELRAVMMTKSVKFSEAKAHGGNVVLEKPSPYALIRYTGVKTVSGSCGMPLVVKMGNLSFIAGYHLLYVKVSSATGESSLCYGEELNAEELGSAVRRLTQICRVIPEVHISGMELNAGKRSFHEDVELVELPKKSSVWAAISQGASNFQVLGSLKNPFPMGPQKSKCKRSLLARFFVDKERTLCGVSPYYVAPNPKGMLVADQNGLEQWVDPYVVNLLNYRNKNANLELMNLAVKDYLYGVDELVGLDKVRALTDLEVVVGVPGRVSALNLKTSMGPPIHRKKKEFFTISEDRMSFVVDDFFKECVLYIENILDSGKVYVPVSYHSLKDEPISIEKNEKKKIRVFNTMPCVYNFLLKKYLGDLCAFMREHWSFFETMVGKNINSLDLDLAVDFMKRMTLDMSETELKECFGDGDFQFYDIRISTDLKLGEVDVWEELLQKTSLTRIEVQRAVGLLLGLVYTVRNVKNDIFLLCFAECSGDQVTVDNNDFGNALAFRYSFHRKRILLGIKLIWFRHHVSLLLQGDDNWFGRGKSVKWFNYQALIEGFTELGMTYTATDKSGENINLKSLEECSFLKRQVRKVGTRWEARLELKSLVKMLVCVKKSELSDTDHYAVLVSNVNRELYFHGEEIFDEWMLLINQAVRDLDLTDSVLLKLYSFHELEVLYSTNIYPKWMVPERDVFGQILYSDLEAVTIGGELQSSFS